MLQLQNVAPTISLPAELLTPWQEDGRGRSSQNPMFKGSASRAIVEFVRSAKRATELGIVANSVGIFDGQLYVWSVLENIDVVATKKLFALKSAIEQREGAEFELHVAALQGRPLDEVIPRDFEIVVFD